LDLLRGEELELIFVVVVEGQVLAVASAGDLALKVVWLEEFESGTGVFRVQFVKDVFAWFFRGVRGGGWRVKAGDPAVPGGDHLLKDPAGRGLDGDFADAATGADVEDGVG
jgi:hypothetical protein